jgi:protein-disulfide isomerase
VLKLTNDDGKIRLVLKELPIFGEDSEAAAKLALASDKQGKYFEMHQKLMTEPGKADKDKALRIAKELNLDIEKLEKDAESDDVKKGLDEAKELAQKLNLQGTPLYLIGDRVVPGAPDDLYDQLKAKVTEVREKGCASTC